MKELDNALKLIGHDQVSKEAEVELYNLFIEKKKLAKEKFTKVDGKDGNIDWAANEDLTTEYMMYENAYKAI